MKKVLLGLAAIIAAIAVFLYLGAPDSSRDPYPDYL